MDFDSKMKGVVFELFGIVRKLYKYGYSHLDNHAIIAQRVDLSWMNTSYTIPLRESE